MEGPRSYKPQTGVRFPGGSRRDNERKEVAVETKTKCFSCGGPFHPATGHYHRPDVPVCGPCTKRFVAWLKGHTKRRWGGKDFYAHAATSIKPGMGRST